MTGVQTCALPISTNLTWRAQRLEQALAEMEPSTTDEIRAMQLAEQTRLHKWLTDGVSTPLKALTAGEGAQEPAVARRAIEKIDAELDRLEAAVERLPSIGLVTDRGAG